MNAVRNDRFGFVEAERTISDAVVSTGVGQGIYTWHPSEELSRLLPSQFTLSLRCYVVAGEGRRWWPTNSADDFVYEAFLAGLAIRQQLEPALSAEELFSYRMGELFFWRLQHAREALRRKLTQLQDLVVRRSGREDTNRTILPLDCGLDEAGNGQPWGLERLLSEGKQEAIMAGIARPAFRQQIRYGLVQAASLRPLYLEDAEVQSVVRQALFGYVNTELSEETRRRVTEVALDVMRQHAFDEAEKFEQCVRGGRGTFVLQISKRKKLVDAGVSRDDVRLVLNQLGWDGYRGMAQCVGYFARVFERLNDPDSLTELERRQFERTFFALPIFGGLVSLQLAQRFDLLGPVVHRVYQERDVREAAAVMHRLLHWFSEMASARRAADRRIQHGRGARTAEGRTSVEVLEEDISHHPVGIQQSSQLAERLAYHRGVSCECVDPRWRYWRERTDTPDMIEITLGCDTCEWTESFRLPADVFHSLATCRGQADD